jgi:hypothetical protein
MPINMLKVEHKQKYMVLNIKAQSGLHGSTLASCGGRFSSTAIFPRQASICEWAVMFRKSLPTGNAIARK